MHKRQQKGGDSQNRPTIVFHRPDDPVLVRAAREVLLSICGPYYFGLIRAALGEVQRKQNLLCLRDLLLEMAVDGNKLPLGVTASEDRCFQEAARIEDLAIAETKVSSE